MNVLNLLTPDTLNILFALAGAGFGWWLKRHPDRVPPELAETVSLLIARHAAAKQFKAHDLLQSLSQAPTVPVLNTPTTATTPAPRS